MAKIALVALLVAALAVSGFAREPTFQRALQQSNVAFTCSQAKALQGRGCSDMLNCLRQLPEFKSMGTPANLKLFEDSCKRCATAANSCPADNSLPVPCRAGLSIAPVRNCALKLAPKNAAVPTKKAAATSGH